MKKWKQSPTKNWLLDIEKHSDYSIQSDLHPRFQTEFDEPSVLDYLYTFINDDSKFAVDIGAWPYGNDIDYIVNKFNWDELLIDGHPKQLKENIKEEWITKENIIAILEKYECPKQIEVLKIDIDNMDYWILREILSNKYIPKIILFEFNPMFKYDETYSKVYYPNCKPNGSTPLNTGDACKSSWYGASLGAFIKLGKEFGYNFIYTGKLPESGKLTENYKNCNSNNGWLLHNNYIRKNDKLKNPNELHTEFIEKFKEYGNRTNWSTTNISELKQYFLDNKMIQEV